jgi:hypothetical protein
MRSSMSKTHFEYSIVFTCLLQHTLLEPRSQVNHSQGKLCCVAQAQLTACAIRPAVSATARWSFIWTALSTGTAQRWSDATLCTPTVQILAQTTSSTSTRCNKTWPCAKQVQVPIELTEWVHFSWAPNRSTHKKCRPSTTTISVLHCSVWMYACTI